MSPRKQFSLEYLLEPLLEKSDFLTKPMFGGLAGYRGEKICICIMENPGDKEYRGVTYDFDIWNGILFPCERDVHESLRKDFSTLRPHPVLPKWLYIPMSEDDFEATVEKLIKLICRGDERMGCIPVKKKKKKSKK